jgi:hypothetical protein
MPTASIVSPLTDDTVAANNVVISVAYADFSTATDLKCKIEERPDTPASVTGSGLHIGTPINTVLSGRHTVITFTDSAGELARQDNVIVSANTPTPIDEPEIEEDFKDGPKKIKKIRGRAPVGVYVVCQIIEVDARARTQTVVGTGAATVAANRTWRVDFDPHITLNLSPWIQYAARAFVYAQNMTLIGSETRPARKP